MTKFTEMAIDIINIVEGFNQRPLKPQEIYLLGKAIQEQSGMYWDEKESIINDKKQVA